MNLAKELKGFKGEVKFNEPLSRHTTFRIGGRAKVWARPEDIYSLKLLLKIAAARRMPVLLIGRGSNLLIADKPINALVINLSTGNFSNISKYPQGLIAGSGVSVNKLIERCAEFGFTGLEFLAGIPATLGGAIRMNAAAKSSGKPCSMADVVREIKVMAQNGRIKTLKKNDFKFGYKSCNISECLILEAKLKLRPALKSFVKILARENIARKREAQDLNHPSAGCIFKNPSQEVSAGLTAGYLIDRAGLKGFRVGSAQVSLRHANFIINCGGASAQDVLKLMKEIKLRVKKVYNIELVPEIGIIKDIEKIRDSRQARIL